MKLRAVVCGLSVAASLGTAAPSGAGVSLGIFLTTLPKESIEALFGATRRHAILQYVLEWYNSAAAAHTAAMQARAEAGAVPMCVWGTGGHDKGYGFDSIISGTHDAYIRDVAGSVSAFNKPVIIAFCPEFNHRSSPYYYLNDPSRSTAKYAEMWRHVHGIFREAGATNAQWAFCPNYQGDPVTDANLYYHYYPGDAYVDWVGALGFDTDWASGGSAGLSFHDIFGRILGDQASRYPNKPQLVMWFGTAGDTARKEAWIGASYGAMGLYPNLRAVVWYNKTDTAGFDYRVWDTSGVQASVTAAYREAISAPLFLDTLPPYDDLVPADGGGGALDLTPIPATVRRGAQIALHYAFSGILQRVDAYLGVEMTDGTLLVMDSRQVFQPRIIPVASNLDASGNPSGALSFTVPETIPTGVYTFKAVWVPAGAPVTEAGVIDRPVTVVE
ncbi:MAG: hypothetical protein IT574_01000 [Candidatus Aureabacteria bacterium]|nr:hypothetical protein [Candidatus Auribacterota bacterium]NLW93184.1 hypothetical protein [Chlamydiota bacterium]HOE26767.1 hypothetical protein [bacterium]HQM53164.1 hypothetical protein [bacterium]